MALQPDVPGTGRARPHPVPPPEQEPPPRGDGGVPEPEVSAAAEPAGALPEPVATAEPAAPGAQLVAGMPRWLLLLAGAAAATVAIAGLRAIAWLAGPVFLALVVVIALAPVQSWLRRAGVPRWLATAVLLILVWTVLLLFVGLLVASAAQLAALLPDYADEAQTLLNGVVADLNNAGLVSGRLSDLIAQIDYGQVVGIATGVLSRFTDAASTLVLLLAALVFMAIESSGFPRRIALVGAERPHLPVALGLFASGTRSYLLVSTVFGAIVALGDWIALAWLGVPAAALWGLLAFITNYVPNIGFVLGLIPPALLGLLAGGWHELIAIVVIYSVLNFVVQTLIQPRFVGDSVGLSTTVTFVALLFWGWVLGALGALLAIPLTLLVKAMLVDVDPRGHWLDVLLREEPRAPRTNRARRRMHARRDALASVRRLHHRRGGHPPPEQPDPTE
jgi:AI-2 transport protein TqsA